MEVPELQKLAYLAFIIIGLASTVHGMALPFLIENFSLSLAQAGLLLFFSSSGYLVACSAFPFLEKRISVILLLLGSTVIFAICYTTLPLLPWWTLFLGLAFCASLGTGTIDVGFNTLVSSLEPKIAQSALNWLHFSYGIGALLGPALLSRLMKFGFSWQIFYLLTGLVAFSYIPLWVNYARKIQPPSKFEKPCLPTENLRLQQRGLAEQKIYWLILIVIFIYVAVEVALIGWIPTLLTNLGVNAINASLGISLLWFGISLGRAMATQIVKRVPSKLLLLVLTSGSGLAMLALIFAQPTYLVFFLIFLIGLFLSAIFPLFISQSALLFPQFISESTSGIVVAGSFGGMIGPMFLGLIGQYYSLQFGVAVLAGFMLLSTLIITTIPSQPATENLASSTKETMRL